MIGGLRGRWGIGLVVLVVGLVVGLVFVWRARRPREGARAVWVWSDEIMREDSARVAFFAWARRHGIDRVYQHVEPLLIEDPEAVMRFLRQARVEGFRVEALLGDPIWLVVPDSALARIDRLLSLHDRVGTDTLAAIHLDVEPHTATDWTRQQGEVVRAFQRLLDLVRAHRGTRTVPLHVDLPLWYDQVALPDGTVTSLADWINQRVDGVTLMAYETNDAVFWPALEAGMARARRDGTAVRVGIETACSVGVEASFCTLGRPRLEARLTALEQRFAGDPVWGGAAVHFYPEAVRLLP